MLVEKMKTFCVFVAMFAIFFTPVFGQNCIISKNYEDFIEVKKESYNDRSYLTTDFVKSKGDKCYSKLIDNNLPILNYLLTIFFSLTNYDTLLEISDSLELKKQYISALEQDSSFTVLIDEFAAKTINGTSAKDTIKLDYLLNIAVKFFKLNGINPEGNYSAKICIGINDLAVTEINRKPYVEGFCFSSIFKNLQNDKYNIYDDFIDSIKELYKINFGIDKDENLIRSQGAMYIMMFRNEKLKQMLLDEYDLNKDHLPFVLKGL